jgi:hypothetical protein
MTEATPTRLVASRVAAAAVGAALTGLAVKGLWNLRLGTLGAWIFWGPVTLFLLTTGVLCGWFALKGHQPASRTRVQSTWRTGWIVGGVGLALGYVGPLLITPKASLGPLFGIFVTGPLGFVLGALGGAVFHESRRAR